MTKIYSSRESPETFTESDFYTEFKISKYTKHDIGWVDFSYSATDQLL